MTYRATPGRLDAVLATLTGRSRADVQRAIDRGLVLVEGERRARSHRLSGGELLEVAFPQAEAPAGEPGPLDVRFEDDHLLVVSKPAGMVVHPTARRRSGTLVQRLLGNGVPLSTGSDPDRPGIVHRLDAGTSGLLVVAKDDAAHEALRSMFARRDVDRRYLTLVRGVVRDDSFSVQADLGRRRSRTVLAPGGVASETAFAVRERLALSTLLEARPRTGRTHQIRAHLAAIGHPILGDQAYGGGGDDATRLGLTRPFLHSFFIGFTHPLTGERVEVEDPLPTDLSAAVEAARLE